MAQILLDAPVAQAILDYLVTQPYRNVFHLVHALQGAQPAPVPAPEADKPALAEEPAA